MELTQVKLFDEALQFDKTSVDFEKVDNGRLEFISKFPLENLKDLTLDEYCAGTDKNSFSYWLEFKDIPFGIGGGDASKFGIYKSKEGLYCTVKRRKNNPLTQHEAEMYFEDLKQVIINSLELTRNNEIEKIGQLNSAIWDMVLIKILFIYFPDKFISIGKKEVLKDCATDIGIDINLINESNWVYLNHLIRKRIDSIPVFQDWNYQEIGSYIWKYYYRMNPNDFINGILFTLKKIEQNKFENIELKINDWTFVESKDQQFSFKSLKSKLYFNLIIDEKVNWIGIHSLNPENLKKEVEITHCRVNQNLLIRYGEQTKFLESYNFNFKNPMPRKSVIRLFENEDINTNIISTFKTENPDWEKVLYDILEWNVLRLRIKLKLQSQFNFHTIKESNNDINFPKNLILYGPPGTGKTYSSKDRANEILGKEPTIGVNCFFITFHQSYSYEQFIEGLNVRTENNQAVYNIRDGIFKKAANTAKLNKDENIVLIIDEINRGNISKIFGELITLIEDDKRLGEENEIIVTLPYSGEQFGVPPNLYIIGTMNTADRSLVQLDTALRRRFDFEEMMPKYADKILWVNNGILKYTFEEKDFELNLSNFLQKLNERICKEYDREHQIGHSYLMKVKDLKELQRAWENRIMPLLQEYFYSSLESLENIIGTSDYLNKENDTWVLNMKVENGDFANEFTKIYKKLIPSLEQDDSNKNQNGINSQEPNT